MRLHGSASLGLLLLGAAIGGPCGAPADRGNGCAGPMRDMVGRGRMPMSRVRHHIVMRRGLPAPYRGRKNPLRPTPEVLRKGRVLYEKYCQVCHGASGRGDGPAAEGLDPRPTDIARSAKMPMASDAYLFWTLSEGGAAVGSAMPPFRDALGEDEIWSLILYLREL